jgi:type I restriction enzyme R subunit
VAPTSEPLGKRLFKRRLELLALLPTTDDGAGHRAAEEQGSYGVEPSIREGIIDHLHAEVAAMNLNNFIVRPEREHVTRYADRGQWITLDEAALLELRQHVAGLPSEQESEHITAKLFDLACLNLQIARVNATADFITWRDKVIELASELETRDAIPAVKAELALIQEVQTEAFWKDITLPMIESMRRKLRGLIKFIERKAFSPVYTVLTDEKGVSTEVQLKDFSTGINLAQYKRKVEAYIRSNQNHIVIAKLKHNKALTPTDLGELERFVYESDDVGGRKRFEESFGANMPLALFIRSLVGLDRSAAKEAFGQFLDENRYTSQQIRFVEMIVEKLTQRGVMDPGQLYEPPFTGLHYQGLDGAFGDGDAEAIVEIISDINQRAAA